jgi:hypothetical protein
MGFGRDINQFKYIQVDSSFIADTYLLNHRKGNQDFHFLQLVFFVFLAITKFYVIVLTVSVFILLSGQLGILGYGFIGCKGQGQHVVDRRRLSSVANSALQFHKHRFKSEKVHQNWRKSDLPTNVQVRPCEAGRG